MKTEEKRNRETILAESVTEIADEDITIPMNTAGTTGHHEGVLLTHNAFVSYVLDNVDPANPEIEERNLPTVPLCHVGGNRGMLADHLYRANLGHDDAV